MKIIASTSQSINEIDTEFYKFLHETGFKYIPRSRKSIPELARENDADGVVIWEKNPTLYVGENKFFFHPSMAKNRLSAYRRKGMIDPLITACQLEPTDKVLDCTLGLGADSIVLSYFTSSGEVTGLESSIGLAYVVKWGMKLYSSQMPWLDEVIKRIKVINADHYEFLKHTGNNAYDIIYFDPMFRKPQLKSQAISPLRVMANHSPLKPETIREACRVARKRVVVKEMAGSGEFKRLGINYVAGSPNRKIHYGVIEILSDRNRGDLRCIN